jgi:hypothetical protein
MEDLLFSNETHMTSTTTTLLERRGSRMIHDESNKLLVQMEEQYVHQIVQEHRRNTSQLREQEMPRFDD